MPSERSLENLKKGKKTQFKSGDEAARINGSKGGKAYGRNNSIRKLAKEMLSATPEVGDGTLRQLKQLGFNAETPDLQTLILARIGAMAIGKDSRLALQATQMLLEIAGSDVRSMIATDDHELQREKLELERDRFNFEKEKSTGNSANEARNGTVNAIIEAVKNIE